MCDQKIFPFCSSHAKQELEIAIRNHEDQLGFEHDSPTLRKARKRLREAQRAYFITKEGLNELERSYHSEIDPQKKKSAKYRLANYKNLRKRFLLIAKLPHGANPKCTTCEEEVTGQKSQFCSKDCEVKFRNLPKLRHCKDCDKTPQEAEFGKHPGTRDGLSIVCKPCNRKRVKKSEQNYSSEKWAEIAARRKSDAYKDRGLLKRFGIGLEIYRNLIALQQNKCEICKNGFSDSDPAHIDHDHSTGKVRGLLCRTCNFGLGLFKDDPMRLRLALGYLKRTSSEDHIQKVVEVLSRRVGEIRLDVRSMRGIIPFSKEGRVRLLECQEYKCACCNDDLSHQNFRKINIDHNHSELFIRGMICKHCNIGIGQLKEDEALFNSAIIYLAKHSPLTDSDAA